jgi:hypothetical protein
VADDEAGGGSAGVGVCCEISVCITADTECAAIGRRAYENSLFLCCVQIADYASRCVKCDKGSVCPLNVPER